MHFLRKIVASIIFVVILICPSITLYAKPTVHHADSMTVYEIGVESDYLISAVGQHPGISVGGALDIGRGLWGINLGFALTFEAPKERQVHPEIEVGVRYREGRHHLYVIGCIRQALSLRGSNPTIEGIKLDGKSIYWGTYGLLKLRYMYSIGRMGIGASIGGGYGFSMDAVHDGKLSSRNGPAVLVGTFVSFSF